MSHLLSWHVKNWRLTERLVLKCWNVALLFAKRCQFLVLHLFIYFFNFKAIWASQDNHGVILLCTPRKASQLRGFCFMLPTGETFRKSRNHFILCILLKLKQVNLSKINLLKCSFCTLNTLYTISSIIKYKSYKFYRDYFLHSLCTVLLAAHEH